jgi:hypothetical protein
MRALWRADLLADGGYGSVNVVERGVVVAALAG